MNIVRPTTESIRPLNLFAALTDTLRTSLHSFANNYQSVMWRLRECSLNDQQLGMALGISSNVVRNRRAKPDRWKLSDVERLAAHFTVPDTACTQLNAVLHQLPDQLKSLSGDERRKMEQLLLIKLSQLELYNQTDWPVRQLLKMHQALIHVNR